MKLNDYRIKMSAYKNIEDIEKTLQLCSEDDDISDASYTYLCGFADALIGVITVVKMIENDPDRLSNVIINMSKKL